MLKECTRREFIKAATGTAVAGILVSLPALSGCARCGIRCSQCGAVFNQGHRHQEGTLSGVYCPNCGVELSRLCHDVAKSFPWEYRRKVSKSRKKTAVWEWAQVPFPNAGWVRETDKPTAVLAAIRF